MDIYRDYFTREQLMASLAKAPYTPGRLGELGIFETIGLTSTTLALEEDTENAAAVLADTPRGTPSRVETLEKRKVHTFQTGHIRDDGAVYADEVLNARGAGAAGAAEILQNRRDRLLARMRRTIDLTLESKRMTALKTPSNGFGNAPASAVIALATDTTKTRQEIFNKVITPIESALGAIPFTGVHMLCSDTYWAALIENKSIKDTYLNTQMAGALRADPRDMFTFGGVTFERYRGQGAVALTAGSAIAFPVGAPMLFVQAFAPADVIDQVGAGVLGQPYYSQAILSQDRRYWYLEAQSSPVMVCTRPAAIITTTLT